MSCHQLLSQQTYNKRSDRMLIRNNCMKLQILLMLPALSFLQQYDPSLFSSGLDWTSITGQPALSTGLGAVTLDKFLASFALLWRRLLGQHLTNCIIYSESVTNQGDGLQWKLCRWRISEYNDSEVNLFRDNLYGDNIDHLNISLLVGIPSILFPRFDTSQVARGVPTVRSQFPHPPTPGSVFRDRIVKWELGF